MLVKKGCFCKPVNPVLRPLHVDCLECRKSFGNMHYDSPFSEIAICCMYVCMCVWLFLRCHHVREIDHVHVRTAGLKSVRLPDMGLLASLVAQTRHGACDFSRKPGGQPSEPYECFILLEGLNSCLNSCSTLRVKSGINISCDSRGWRPGLRLK